MLFNSVQFAAFFVLAFSTHWFLPKHSRNAFLLIASYVFYGAWDYRFLSLIAVSTAVDFSLGRWLESSDKPRQRRLLLFGSIATNMGILLLFKYANFFIDSIATLLALFGFQPNYVFLNIVLPVGISFYSFQTLSYTFDIYRGRINACESLIDFGLYVAFFPQLVAGPIERANHLLPQIQNRDRTVNLDDMRTGAFLILIGLFRKVVIADTLAPLVDQAFSGSAQAGWIELSVGVYAFALQIYGDFAGYSDIARGVAKMLGVDLVVNFRQPYLSRNISEFWRTWHISLSAWLHDYLYVPLGGNRNGRFRTYRNLMLTMLIGGLWHGASWTFVAWGGLHGIALALHRLSGRYVPRGFRAPLEGWHDLWRIVGTFHIVGLGWVLFRAESWSVAMSVFAGIGKLRAGPIPEGDIVILLVAACVSLLLDVSQRNSGVELSVLKLRPAWRGLVYGLMLTGIIVTSGSPVRSFIYFQF